MTENKLEHLLKFLIHIKEINLEEIVGNKESWKFHELTEDVGNLNYIYVLSGESNELVIKWV
jgi:hypothetical protein